MAEKSQRVVRFNTSSINDVALARTILDECLELLCGIQQPPMSTDSEESCAAFEQQRVEAEKRIYAYAADLFEGLTGMRVNDRPDWMT